MVFKSYKNISFGHQGYTAIVHLLKNLAVFLNFLSSMGIIFFNFIYASMVIAPKVILFWDKLQGFYHLIKELCFQAEELHSYGIGDNVFVCH